MKRIRCIFSIALVFAFLPAMAVQGQQKAVYTPDQIANMKKVREMAIASPYALDQTRYLTNNIGPRLSGSPQADRAVEYVAEQLRKMGLRVTLQEIMVPHWERGKETAELVEFPGMAPGTTQKLSITALGGSTATPDAGITAEVVVVNDLQELAALSDDFVKGKIVFFNNKFDREMAKAGRSLEAYGLGGVYRRVGALEATKKGAVASVIRSVGSSENRLAHTGGIGFEEGIENVPAAAVSYEDGELVSYLAGQGKIRMHLTLTPKTYPDKKSYNVIGDLVGSERPDEIVVVGGHLDSWDLGTGALDDAVGVAMAMQVPKLLIDAGIKPKRTIRVVAFMNEENGFRGARKYAEEADMAKHAAAIESDLGADHPTGFQFAGSKDAMSFLTPIAEILSVQGAGFVEFRPEGVSSDISLLTNKGVPSFAPQYDTRRYFDYHHNAADTFDKVRPKELAENAALMTVLAYAMADLDGSLPR
ncbi:MAG: M20/M25/M40 family metallo-hydrolase [Pyrinomonadaceae bacterium]